MKKLIALMMVLLCMLGVQALAEEVDAYTSASTTKTLLAGEELDTAAALLAATCSDLAPLAQTKVEGYTAPSGVNAQIMSVNPDGSVGMSTISEWKYVQNADGKDQVIVELTYGQNALNLSEEGARGTLLVLVDGASYLVHLDVLESDEQVYTDEAYNAGEFDAHYSGAANQLSSYTITCEVLSIEMSHMLLF